ncbi:MAG: AAA family ATPase [Jatrophihabitantaceae bacterium]
MPAPGSGAMLPDGGQDSASTATDSAQSPELRETHSAVVLLLGEHAYKIKKRVDLGFLDFLTDASRKQVCQRELELNRRLAPDVYLDVISIRGATGHDYEQGLLMRRMPDRLRLSTMISRGEDVSQHLRALAQLIATFHAGAERGPEIVAEAGATGLRRRWTDNLRETESFLGNPLAETLHTQISDLALRYVDGRGALLAERAAAGLFVDGHGDLLADDVFCMPDYPRVLDCIEFDDRLRWVDTLDDVCFLAMDLEHLHRADLAQHLLDWYVEFSGTAAVRSLQHHYIAYRAFVRAKVSCIRAGQGSPSASADADSYARLALAHLRAGEPRLVLIGGAPGTGKTTLSRAVVDDRDWVLLSSDEVRRQLPADPDDRYSPAAKAATYRELLRRARHALEHGQCVIADASWGDVAMRQLAENLADQTASTLIALECRAPVAVTATRAEHRLAQGDDASEAGADIARRLAASRDPWPGAIGIPTDTTPDTSLRAALTALGPSTQ